MKNKFAKLLLGIMPLIGSGCSLLKKLPAAKMLDMLENITAYVLNSGCELKDGETIGMTPTHKLPIIISEGIVMDGETIKIPYSLP